MDQALARQGGGSIRTRPAFGFAPTPVTLGRSPEAASLTFLLWLNSSPRHLCRDVLRSEWGRALLEGLLVIYSQLPKRQSPGLWSRSEGERERSPLCERSHAKLAPQMLRSFLSS